MNDHFNEPITPAKIAEIETMKFRIPLYQRPYAWEEKQVLQLLGDLHDQFEKNKDEHYHIGILSVAKTRDDPHRFDIIDGQQRITTLMLIGKAASKFDDWKSFIGNKRLELYGRRADQEFLDSDGTDESTNIEMRTAVNTAKKYFEDHKAEQAEFSRFIFKKTAFFVSEVLSAYTILDKNRQFVRMNNRGRQLENHEILKVQLTSKVDDEPEQSEVLKKWNDMLDYLTGTKDTNGRETLEEILGQKSNGKQESSDGNELFYKPITTVPEFLLIALERYLKKENKFDSEKFSPATDKLLQTFEVLGKQDIVGFANVIEEQVRILRSYFIRISRDGSNKVQYKFASKDDAKSEYVYSSNFIDKDNRKQHLKAVQSFLHVSTEPHHWLVPAFDWCENCSDGKINAEDFVKELEKIDNDLIDTDRRKLTSIKELEEMVYGNISHYWFYRLDYELWKSYQNKSDEKTWAGISSETENVKKLFENFRFRRCSSIEHINPQKPTEGKVIEDVDSFGNLALISGSRNSKFGNDLTEGKKQLILASEYTESIKMAHFLWFGNGNIKKAGETMYKILYYAVYSKKPAETAMETEEETDSIE